MVEELFGSETLKTNSGGYILPSEAFGSSVKLLGILFAHYRCPLTSDITVKLKEIYSTINTEDKKVFEIVYCLKDEISDDLQCANFIEKVATMPWLVLAKDDPRFFKISKRFQVKTGTRLILMTTEGEVIDDKAEQRLYSGRMDEIYEIINQRCVAASE